MMENSDAKLHVAAVNRRQFLLSASAAAVPGSLCASEDRSRRLDEIGIQLYTVRDLMAADLEATLERLAGIGYRQVEFAGYYERSAANLRRLLANLGLSTPSAHVPIAQARTGPDRLIEYAVELGHDYLVIPWLDPSERQTLAQYRALADLLNRFGEQCRAAGLQLAYHNHDFEFEAIDGVLPMDLLLAETDDGLVRFEIDLYWICKAGRDPLDYFDRYTGRFPLCHVKDMAADGDMVPVGAGTIDFAEIFARSPEAGLHHYFVEHDNADDALASSARSYEYLSQLRF